MKYKISNPDTILPKQAITYIIHLSCLVFSLKYNKLARQRNVVIKEIVRIERLERIHFFFKDTHLFTFH